MRGSLVIDNLHVRLRNVFSDTFPTVESDYNSIHAIA